jgi:integrase
MPRLVHKFPAYRLHKPSGQAVVGLGGKSVYLGPYGSDLSKGEFDRVLAEFLTNGRRPPGPPAAGPPRLTVSELILRYWLYAQRHYQRDGRPTRELDNIRHALRGVRDLYGHTPADQFGPVALKAVVRAMVDAALCRNTVNFRTGKIRRLFRWAAENELVPPQVYQGLRAVAGLRRGRDGVRETEPVRPVPDAHVAAVLPHVSAPVRAMIQLQELTGMRPGEVTAMRGRDLDRSGAVWVYRPADHKTRHHGHERAVPLGPRAQDLLRPWLKGDLDAYCFSPADAVAARNAARQRARRTPMTPSQARRRPKPNPQRPSRDRYDKNSYGQAVRRACEKAGVPHWHPNRLRHNAATRIRRGYGLEAARQVLGHRSGRVTEVYAEADLGRVVQIMAEIG